MSEIQPDRATEGHGHGVFTVLNSYLGGEKAVESQNERTKTLQNETGEQNERGDEVRSFSYG